MMRESFDRRESRLRSDGLIVTGHTPSVEGGPVSEIDGINWSDQPSIANKGRHVRSQVAL